MREAHGHADSGGLASAVAAEEAVDGAFGDAERKAVDGAGSFAAELTLPVTVNGVKGLAVLDTGSRDTRINSRFAATAHIDPSSADQSYRPALWSQLKG
jgi:hypothetical protein